MLRSAMQKGVNSASVPSEVTAVLRRLQEVGHHAYLVGGCVRDLLMGITPHDWDVTTDAHPERVLSLFPKTHSVGARFGTVGVLTLNSSPVEVTTFRMDIGYDDHRRPSQVVFASSVQEDLARRDFTINAIAWDPISNLVVDPFGGRQDIDAATLRAVGDADERFREDALRMMRAVRFTAQLGFTLDLDTWSAIEREAARVRHLSNERVRDELLRILATPRAGDGVWLLHELGLLRHVLPELQATAHMPQGKPGAPTLLAHLIQAVDATPPNPTLRLAALLHDIGKLSTRQITPEGRIIFHGHEVAGAEVAQKICRRLRLPNHTILHITSLIRMHMISGDDVGKKGIRRWLGAHGPDWVRDLIALRRADHVASGGDPGNNPFADRLERELDAVIAEGAALSVRDLAVNGHDIMTATGVPPGPELGAVLRTLLDRVLEDPSMNEAKRLLQLAQDLVKRD